MSLITWIFVCVCVCVFLVVVCSSPTVAIHGKSDGTKWKLRHVCVLNLAKRFHKHFQCFKKLSLFTYVLPWNFKPVLVLCWEWVWLTCVFVSTPYASVISPIKCCIPCQAPNPHETFPRKVRPQKAGKKWKNLQLRLHLYDLFQVTLPRDVGNGRWMEGGCWVAQRWRVWPVWNGSIPGTTLEAKPNEEMIWGFTGFQKGGEAKLKIQKLVPRFFQKPERTCSVCQQWGFWLTKTVQKR